MPWFGDTGSRLYYEESGRGDPVVLLPGWAGSIDEFVPLRAALAQHFRVIAVDLPGSGGSEPQPRTFTPTYYHDDVPVLASCINAVAAAPVRLVGCSDGGEYALMIAAARAVDVRTVVTWGALGYVPHLPEMVDALATAVDSPVPAMQAFSDYLKATYGEANARTMATSEATALDAIMRAGGDLMRARASDVVCPVLMIAGEYDPLATPTRVAGTAKALPHAAFIEATGAGHPVHQDQPAWLIDTVTSWLTTH